MRKNEGKHLKKAAYSMLASLITLLQVFLYNKWNATALKYRLNEVHVAQHLTKGKGAFHELLSFVLNSEKRLKHIPEPFPLNEKRWKDGGRWIV